MNTTAHPPNTDATHSAPPNREQRSALAVCLAVIWTLLLFLLLPAINRIGPPPNAAFLFTIQLALTFGSLLAASTLLLRPRKRWLLLTLPFDAFLILVTGTIWTHFP